MSVLQELVTIVTAKVDTKAVEAGANKIAQGMQNAAHHAEHTFSTIGKFGGEAGEKVVRAFEKIKSLGPLLASLVNPVTIATAAVAALGAAVYGAFHGVSKAAEEARELEHLGAILGGTASDADSFIDSFTGIGVSAESAKSMITSFSRNVQDAAMGMGRAKPVFDKLGIATVDAAGKTRSTLAVMGDLKKKMSGMDFAGQSALVEKLGLGPDFLKQFDHDMAYIEKRQKSLSDSLTPGDSTSGTLNEYQNYLNGMRNEARLVGFSFSKMWQGFSANATKAFTPVIKSITSMYAGIVDFMKKNGAAIQEFGKVVYGTLAVVASIIMNIVKGIVWVGKTIFNILAWVGGIVNSLIRWLGLGDSLGSMFDDLALWVSDFFLLLSFMPRIWKGYLILVYREIVGWVDRVTTLMGDLWRAWEPDSAIGKWFKSVANVVIEEVRRIWDAIPRVFKPEFWKGSWVPAGLEDAAAKISASNTERMNSVRGSWVTPTPTPVANGSITSSNNNVQNVTNNVTVNGAVNPAATAKSVGDAVQPTMRPAAVGAGRY